jgi:hypothetical protein
VLRQSEHFGEIALVSEKRLEPVTVKAVERAGLLSYLRSS